MYIVCTSMYRFEDKLMQINDRNEIIALLERCPEHNKSSHQTEKAIYCKREEVFADIEF